MPAVELVSERVTVPGEVVDLSSFSRWVDSAEFPEHGRISFIRGTVRVETEMEQPFTHNVVKLWIGIVLATLVRDLKLGTFFTDRMRLRNDIANLSTEPDGMFVSFESLESDQIRLVEGTTTEYREFEGSPDMVLEVVSESSETKDRVDLRESYYLAGVEEYWLADAREETPVLDILRRGPRAFSTARHQSGGWVRSQVFDRAFRIIRTIDKLGHPQFTLEHRD
jgi:Uma2 family endonuclease